MLDKEGLNAEISVGVTFASLMGAVSLFFTGVLIGQYQSFGPSIKVPLLFLIISTFSFIFAATIYTNASTEVTLGKFKTVKKYMIYAKNIVEFLGLYLLILSTPLVIGAVTKDTFLLTSTIMVAIVGMALYSQSKFSTLQKQLSVVKKQLYSAFIILLALALYSTDSIQGLNPFLTYNTIAVALLASLLIPTVYFCVKSKQYNVTSIRLYKSSDGTALANIIHKNLKRKGKKARSQVREAIAASASETALNKLAEQQHVFVAIFDGRPVGLASLHQNKVSMIFIDPDLHRKGVGRMLVEAVETAAQEQGYAEVEVTPGLTTYKFYKKLGYRHLREDDNDQVVLHKEL